MAPKKAKPSTKKKEVIEKSNNNVVNDLKISNARSLRSSKRGLLPSTSNSVPIKKTKLATKPKPNASFEVEPEQRAIPEVKQLPKEEAKQEIKQKSRKSNAAVDLDFKWEVENGVALTAGEGDVGQLGHGDNVLECPRPRTVEFDKSVVDICAGGMHTVLLTADGEVFTFGCNDDNALGRDTSKEGSECTPGKVDIPYRVVQVSAGDSHSAALTAQGKVYAWGNFRDVSGAMGFNPDGSMQKTPLALLPNSTFTKICSGCDHLVLLGSNGVPFTLGCAEQGQLGRVAPCFAERGGRKGLERLFTPSPIHTRKLHNKNIRFKDVWATSHNTFAKTDDGEIWVCGLNNYCQLGLPSAIGVQYSFGVSSAFNGVDWIQIAGGQHHTLSLSAKGQVFSCGRKEYGRLGLGNNTDDSGVPKLIDSLVTRKVVSVSCGTASSFAVDDSGSVYSWGMSASQLGHGNEINDSDLWEPKQMTSKSLADKRAVCVSSGGQHVVILVDNSAHNNKMLPITK